MPFVFLILGIGLVIVAVRGTHQQAFDLLKSEFTGDQNFLTWALALFILGALGYVPVIRPVTRAMLLLVLLVIVLKNGTGLFDRFNQQVRNPINSASGSVTPGPLSFTDDKGNPVPVAGDNPTLTPSQFQQTPSGQQGLTPSQMQQPADAFSRWLQSLGK